jgi:hypothetical protein
MDDIGWGSESERSPWGTAGSVALLLTTGLYWSSLWLVSGLAPVPTVASRALRQLSLSRSRRNCLQPGQEYAPE